MDIPRSERAATVGQDQNSTYARPDHALAVKSSAGPPEGSAGESKGSQAQNRRPSLVPAVNKRFTRKYAAAVIIGLIPVFISPALWWMTIVGMLVFLVLGYSDADDTGLTYEFADAFYYLGFTLSIGTLLAALDPFHVSKRPDVIVTFHRFGLGMFTTLIGVTGRTIIQAYHRLPTETLDNVNRRITEEGERYLANLRDLNARTAALLGGAWNQYETQVLKPISRLGEAIDDSVKVAASALEHARVLNAAAKDAAEAMSRSAEQATRIGDILSRAASDAGRTIVGAAYEASTQVRKDAAQVGEQLGKAGGTGVESIDGMRVEAERVRAEVVTAARQLEPLVAGPTSLAEVAKQLREATRALAEAVQGDVAQLQAAARIVGEITRRIDESVGALDVTPIANRLVSLEMALKSLNDAAEKQGRVVETQAATIEEQLKLAHTAAEEVNAALDEVADAVTKRLARIT